MKSTPLNPINHICDCSGRRAAPASHRARGWRVASAPGRAARAARAADSAAAGVSAAARSPSGRRRPARAACKVDTSAQGGGSDTRRPGRDTAGATGMTEAAGVAETVTPADDAVRQKIRLRTRPTTHPAHRISDRRAVRRTRPATPARGSGVSDPGTGSATGRAMGRAAGCPRGALPQNRKGTRGIFSGRRDRGSDYLWDCTAITVREPHTRPGPANDYMWYSCMYVE
jgi:hypothetical protein